MPNNIVSQFEEAFAKKISASYAIAVNSGTSALHAALVAIDVRGCDVIMPALCPAMDAFAIIHAGATPVFADVDPFTGLITAETIEPCLTSKTKAIIPVHLFGQSADLEPILAAAAPRSIPVIEDAAQAIGCMYRGKAVGSWGAVGQEGDAVRYRALQRLARGAEEQGKLIVGR